MEAVSGTSITASKNTIGQNGNDSFWALKNISFQAAQGEVLGIIGKNGSGKSTLLRILSGITKPTEGDIILNRRVSSILEIGTGMHPDLTGEENIFLYGKMIGMSRELVQERYGEIAEFSGIGSFLPMSVKNYSNGMYLRLAVSVALHSDASILLFDEVLSAGDAEFKQRTFEKVRSLIGTGVTMILASHSLNEILQLAQRCILLEKGRVTSSGNAQDIIDQYVSGFSLNGNYAESLSGNAGYVWRWKDTDAPGNNIIRLHQVSIRVKENRVDSNIYIEDETEVEILFLKQQHAGSVVVSVVFYDMMNNPVFFVTPLHNKTGEDIWRQFGDETGLFSYKCILPSRFFNHNNYSMMLRFGADSGKELYIHNEMFRFKISKNPKLQYHDISPVVLRPDFQWDYEKIS